ncbi:beta-galactosidase [Prevotella sp. ne3005]|uniref:beta-galactosidase n=1 Tax=Prevotella sp. ne3005 TaxID=1761887 RepID=UPI0008AEC963|nr:beta-galactosidase [Prevotella sp. ne3005]
MKKVRLLLATLLLVFPLMMQAGDFTVGHKTFLLNGEPFVVKAAEVHYPRIPRPYWEHRIQMCKSLGMNTLCIYVFWNLHEPREGQFDFTGNSDVAEFCRLAQKNGMYVIVRPGPYVCAEWEMGGLPWWLLKKKDIRLREQDPYFMERVRIFEEKVAEQLAPLTIQNGGPIIMVQVENEYGSYGEDKAYIAEIRDCLRHLYGAKQTLFQCDWSSNFELNGLDDLVWTMNFGTGANIDEQFKRLKQLRPDAPLMCSEFWSGWFDKWGANHETRPAKDMVDGIEEMLSKNISFSLYMTHGGTSFGHWAGANSPGFAPDVTSYDYDAPINEYGGTTEKFFRLRKMMQKYSKEPLPAIPAPPAMMISIPPFELTERADIILGADSLVMNSPLLTMEEMGQGWGSMLYIATLPEITSESVLTLNECHDYAQVFVDTAYIGKIDRVRNEKSLRLPAVKKGQELRILVEAMGRINFGRAIKDYKGITESVTLTTEQDGHELSWNLKRWNIFTIPDNLATARRALDLAQRDSSSMFNFQSSIFKGSGYYRGYFTLKKTGDTFLNMEAWGKGQVYINGHAIGRFWSIGPQQTLYVPGCWLKKGKNEIIVLDVVGPSLQAYAPSITNALKLTSTRKIPSQRAPRSSSAASSAPSAASSAPSVTLSEVERSLSPSLFSQNHPELDKLNTEKSRLHNNPADCPDLNSATPVVEGQFAPGNGWQTIRFNGSKRGRFVAIQALSSQSEKPEVAIAELYVRDADGNRLSRESWTVEYADSEEINRGNFTGDKVFDLQESTYWQSARKSPLPHLLVIDLGSEQTISALDYLPRAESSAPGSIKNFKIFVY